MATATRLARHVGAAVRELGLKKNDGGWYDRHMMAAQQAIMERVPLVDLVVEIRDARIPFTSAFEPLQGASDPHKRMIVLNKVDLADRSQTEKWGKHFEMQNGTCCGLNSHNKENIKEFLSIVRARIRKLKGDDHSYTATVMLVGIPNVGKSAVSNAMHQIGRIGAEEKGKLKHAVVSPQPGETKNISSYKIASHPNIYVLDTPGVLTPDIVDDVSGSKLALTGAVSASLIGEVELARYFLAVLNLEEEYKRWENSNPVTADALSSDRKGPVSNQRRRRQYPSDHTQDFIVSNVRHTLFSCISSFVGNLKDEDAMRGLIESQLTALHQSFHILKEPCGDSYKSVAKKLLNLYHTGRLGRYTLDPVPRNTQKHFYNLCTSY